MGQHATLEGATLETLASIDHPYYANAGNYYSNEWPQQWDTMTDFLDEFEDADLDYNLVYRWDVEPYDGHHSSDVIPDTYSAQVTIIGQRKGIYGPHVIRKFREHEVARFCAYLEKHWQNLQTIWAPFSGAECAEKERHAWRKDSE